MSHRPGQRIEMLGGLAIALLLAAIAPLAFGQADRKELNPWVDCGVGAMAFEETPWAAVTFNLSWDLGSTAVTSDQSSQDTCASKKAKTALYIGVNYASLAEEAAKGAGKHLHAMMDVMECDSASRSGIVSSVRAALGKHLGGPDYLQQTSAARAEDFYNIIQTAASGRQCGI